MVQEMQSSTVVPVKSKENNQEVKYGNGYILKNSKEYWSMRKRNTIAI